MTLSPDPNELNLENPESPAASILEELNRNGHFSNLYDILKTYVSNLRTLNDSSLEIKEFWRKSTTDVRIKFQVFDIIA
jgi:hypothetical protein